MPFTGNPLRYCVRVLSVPKGTLFVVPPPVIIGTKSLLDFFQRIPLVTGHRICDHLNRMTSGVVRYVINIDFEGPTF